MQAPDDTPRLTLAPARVGKAVLDGGWWPRSWDLTAELPGLVTELSGRYGQIRQVMVNSDTWEGRFRRLTVGNSVVRMGWFTSLDPSLLIAITDRGDQIDLLVVPPDAKPDEAEKAMAVAADPADFTRAGQLLHSGN